MEYYGSYLSPMGVVALVSDGEHLTGLYFDRPVPREEELPLFDLVRKWLDAYFRGENPSVEEIPLKAEGTAFQRLVWKLLLEIPYGQTRTYGEIAGDMARIPGKEKMSAQAVGRAVGSNPISILIPCHRCVGAKGQLTGYAWGLERKEWLLRHEGWTPQCQQVRNR